MLRGKMMHRYYLDESGNSGDLLKSDFSLKFGGQPLFSLSCVGIDDEERMALKLSELKEKYDVDSELKSSEIYTEKPDFFLELVEYLIQNRVPILIELVDKKFCVIANLISSLIIPIYSEIDETHGQNQLARNHLANYMWYQLPDHYLRLFNDACVQREADEINHLLEELKVFFGSSDCQMLEKEQVQKLISASIDEFQTCCSGIGESKAVERYLPIPDILNKSKRKSKAKRVNILPHVHSFFNMIGRLNMYHQGDIANVTLVHDEQKDFDVILAKSKECLVENSISPNSPPTPNSNLNVCSDFTLEFVDSENSVGVQVADLVAGFYVRFINEAFYECKKVESVYIKTFSRLVGYQDFHSPLGCNFVLPHDKQQRVFRVFHF
ncbi:DUF3800 domain-containing protein [Vibrio parahaemolyticus]|uniref:DUF3800 domain-containing protein n=1 Tax=Vibrio parahaemolyticus TaxID=670 RepID=UPI001E3E39FD|nr:DUF3800 domain-containing protein [Vibrio parahaemolyticus]